MQKCEQEEKEHGNYISVSKVRYTYVVVSIVRKKGGGGCERTWEYH